MHSTTNQLHSQYLKLERSISDKKEKQNFIKLGQKNFFNHDHLHIDLKTLFCTRQNDSSHYTGLYIHVPTSRYKNIYEVLIQFNATVDIIIFIFKYQLLFSPVRVEYLIVLLIFQCFQISLMPTAFLVWSLAQKTMFNMVPSILSCHYLCNK